MIEDLRFPCKGKMRAARTNLTAMSRDDGPTRQAGDPDRYAATFAGRAGIILCIGRDPAARERLTARPR